jgi:hypothetical protein
MARIKLTVMKYEEIKRLMEAGLSDRQVASLLREVSPIVTFSYDSIRHHSSSLQRVFNC